MNTGKSSSVVPEHRELYYAGAWHPPGNGRYAETIDPATGTAITQDAGGLTVTGASTFTVASPNVDVLLATANNNLAGVVTLASSGGEIGRAHV